MQRLHFVPVPILIACALVQLGCSESGERVPNRPPIVQIKGGPLHQSVASYTARISWTGWDEDGLVTHYEYALDPPEAFSLGEIADPEHSPDIRIDVHPGPAPDEDTLVVTKGDASFRWIQTREFSRVFAFETPVPDSEYVDGTISPSEQFSGAHTVYVRCQDNDGAYSDADPTTPDELEADYIGFTATTVTPTSRIVQPRILQEVQNLAPTLLVTWEGLDPDSPEPSKAPKGFMYKLLRLDTLEPPVPVIQASPSLLYTRPGPWIYQNGDSLTLNLNLAVLGSYIFGVRAVDVAGAVEPKLELGRNAFRFQALPTSSKPLLVIREPSIGAVEFYGFGEPKDVEVPAKRELYFTWKAKSEDYGEVTEYSWGRDIPDLTAEGPGSGWNPWGPVYGALPYLIFSNPGVHVLAVRARDIAGNMTVAQLVLHVIPFTFEHEVLFVDDTQDNLSPKDNEHDAFWQEMASAYVDHSGLSPEEFFTYDVGVESPYPPPLSELARYKLVIWENFSGYSAANGLIQSTGITPRLSAYLRAGGKLWLGGRMTVGATILAANGIQSDLQYPIELKPGHWAWDFLKLQSTRIMNDRGEESRHHLHSVWPYPGVPAVYDSMTVDLNKLGTYQRPEGGFPYSDAVFDPMYAESDENFRGDIDSLYAYGAAGVEFKGLSSTYHGRLCALRWHDPDPGREHGRVQWFGFALYYMESAQAARTFVQSLDWFREEEPPAP